MLFYDKKVKDFSKDEFIAMARYVVKHHEDNDNITYYFDDILYTYLAHDDNGIKCDICEEKFRPDEIIEMLDRDGNVIHKCHSCNRRLYSVYKCPICGKYHVHHGRFNEFTMLPGLYHTEECKKYGVYTSNGSIPFEKLDILKDMGFSDETVEAIKKYFGMTICTGCAKKLGIADKKNPDGSITCSKLWMYSDATNDPMSEEERNEIRRSPLDTLFKKLGIEEFAKSKYSNPQVRTKSLLVKLINKNNIK